MVVVPFGHHLSLSRCACEDASSSCALPHGQKNPHPSSSEKHNPHTCPICVMAAEMFQTATPQVAVIEVNIPVVAAPSFIPVCVTQPVPHAFLARAPPAV